MWHRCLAEREKMEQSNPSDGKNTRRHVDNVMVLYKHSDVRLSFWFIEAHML